jgi:hypothetical protein
MCSAPKTSFDLGEDFSEISIKAQDAQVCLPRAPPPAPFAHAGPVDEEDEDIVALHRLEAPAGPGEQPLPKIPPFPLGVDDAQEAASHMVLEAKAKLPSIVNGCGCQPFTMMGLVGSIDDKADSDSILTKFRNDPIQRHYKKGGFFGAITSALGDKKTVYCHHLTRSGEFGPRAAERDGKKCTTVEEVWGVLGKSPCCGRFAYHRSTGQLQCGAVTEKDHDRTCNEETCLFLASGLECPTPSWALK